ncbi:hypothetical protein [Thalassovita aquimarina]|uniref:Uncharacterized protein n=1 Tax=Thalassovita aquimarina TaxID=2785917 RepID=A0ABS5HS59_9RHOB|nr:hypothetical protein [Thalassovita aquimarina]MBR9651438.1 hypothetical protein [Thalassovita aquimarina]
MALFNQLLCEIGEPSRTDREFINDTSGFDGVRQGVLRGDARLSPCPRSGPVPCPRFRLHINYISQFIDKKYLLAHSLWPPQAGTKRGSCRTEIAALLNAVQQREADECFYPNRPRREEFSVLQHLFMAGL